MKLDDPEEENGREKVENRKRKRSLRGIERVQMRENKSGKEDCIEEESRMILRRERRREKRKKESMRQ